MIENILFFNAKNFKVREHYETERESIVEKFNEVKEKLAQEREETSSLRIVLQNIIAWHLTHAYYGG